MFSQGATLTRQSASPQKTCGAELDWENRCKLLFKKMYQVWNVIIRPIGATFVNWLKGLISAGRLRLYNSFSSQVKIVLKFWKHLKAHNNGIKS